METETKDDVHIWRIALKSGAVLEFRANWNKPDSVGGRGAVELWQQWEHFRATGEDAPEDIGGYSFYLGSKWAAKLCVDFREVSAILQIADRP